MMTQWVNTPKIMYVEWIMVVAKWKYSKAEKVTSTLDCTCNFPTISNSNKWKKVRTQKERETHRVESYELLVLVFVGRIVLEQAQVW